MKSAPFQSTLNAGEFSPRIEARIDYEKYSAALSRAENLIALPQGGLTLRPGTRYIVGTKTQSAASRIIPFQPTTGASYVVEVGAAYLRFIRNQTQIRAVNVSTAITNGTFPTNITGWTDRSTGTAAIAFALTSLRLTGASDGYAWAEQSKSPSGGDTEITLRFQVTTNTRLGAVITAQVGSTSTGSELYQKDNLGVGWHAVTFNCAAATFYVQFINKTSQNVYIDDVEILDDVPLEITGPYAAVDVSQLRWAQVNDVLYIFHDSYPPYKLKRYGNKSWSIERVYFEDGPWGEINPDIDLAETNLIKNPTFDGGTQDWDDVAGNGVVEYDGTQGVVFFKGDVAETGLSQAIATTASASVHVMHFQVIGSGFIYFNLGTSLGGGQLIATVALKPGWYSYSFTPGAATFYVQFSRDGQGALAVPGLGGVFCYNERANLIQPSGRTGSITIEALGDFKPFVSTDVGRLIRLEYPGRESGWATITAVTDSDTVTAYVHRKLPSVEPCEAWRLGTWSDTTGWPHAATFAQQRLIPVRTTAQPQTIWGSQTGDIENFRPDSFVEGAVTVEDTDALDYTLASEEVSTINWIVGARRLLIGTASGQWLISSRGPVLTPSDFNAEQQVFEETADIPPIKAGNVALFIERAQESLFDLGYNYEVDGLSAADLNITSDHIAAESGMAEAIYQRRPYSTIFVRKSDGSLIGTAYKREQNVVGTTSVTIAPSAAAAAVVESMAVIRGQAVADSQVYSSLGRSEVWLQVRRTINGSTTRYIEVMEGFFRGANRAKYQTRSDWLAAELTAQRDAFYVDAGITYSGVSTTTVTGLGHLEGETVAVLRNGVPHATKVVTNGQITGLTAGTKFQVGLLYNWIYRSLKLPFGSPSGPGVGQDKNVFEVVLALLDSGAFQYAQDHDDNALNFYTVGDVLGANSELFTGEWRQQIDGGWSTDPRIWLKGSSPTPWTLLGIGPKVMENEK